MRKLVISRFRNGGTKMRMRFRTILVVVFAVLAACSTGRTDCGQPSASTWKMFDRRLGI